MTSGFILLLLIQVFILILGISIGRSILLLRLRSEENKKRELELSLLEKQSDVFLQGRKLAHDLEEALYQVKVRQEIDDIIRKNQNR